MQLPPGVFNFDLGAIFIVLGVGLFCVLVGLFFEPVAKWCLNKWLLGVGVTEWKEDGKFQLLKKYYAERGRNPVPGWQRDDKDIPTTTAHF